MKFLSNLPVNGHTIYNTDYQDGDVTLSVLEGGYKLYGQYEIQPGGKSRLTVGDNRLFSLLDLQEHFQLESQTDDYEYYDCEYDFIYVNGTFFSNLPVNGHTIYNTDYQDGDVTLSVLGGYKLYGQYEIQPGGKSRLTVGDGERFSLLDLQEHFQLESQTDDYEYYDCEYGSGITEYNASNGTSYSSCSDLLSPYGVIITTSNGDIFDYTGTDYFYADFTAINDVTWIDFESVDAKVKLEGFQITSYFDFAIDNYNATNGTSYSSCSDLLSPYGVIITTSNGDIFDYTGTDYFYADFTAINDVTWIDFESVDAKVKLEGFNIYSLGAPGSCISWEEFANDLQELLTLFLRMELVKLMLMLLMQKVLHRLI